MIHNIPMRIHRRTALAICLLALLVSSRPLIARLDVVKIDTGSALGGDRDRSA